MSWRVEFRPEVEDDVADAVVWYEAREAGLGKDFLDRILQAWERLTVDPVTGSRRHPSSHIRWRYPDRFPYRTIYEIEESSRTVLVIAVLHAARHDSHWRRRS